MVQDDLVSTFPCTRRCTKDVLPTPAHKVMFVTVSNIYACLLHIESVIDIMILASQNK